MNIWEWIHRRQGKAQKGRPVRVISFEPLEPRLLLSADLIGTQPLVGPGLPFAHEDPGLPVDEQAIVVKLNQEDGGGAINAGSDIAQAAGDLDLTFSYDGKTTTHFGISDGDDYALGMAIQPDGKIVAVGESWNGSNWDFGLARYHTDGTQDATFSGDGMGTTDIPPGDADAWGSG